MSRQTVGRLVRSIALVLVAGMLLAAWEDCIGKGASPRAQMACCAAAEHDCGFADQAMKCCELEQPTKGRLILTELAVTVTPPAPVAVPVAAFAVMADAPPWPGALAHEHPARNVQGIPTYILTGTLLI
ncbi:MAG: hypothetical protein GEU99_16640 [Luteitalea sp.]|nr:hypothetical protein [Luteitalea sp.]